MNPSTQNAYPEELAKFSALAMSWWDPLGPSRPLHELNPVRLRYIEQELRALGEMGKVSQAVLDVAELHALEGKVRIQYRAVAAEELAAAQPAHFDLVTCMEMLEHVPDPAAILSALARLVRPGGDVIISTLNRKPLAFAVAILGAEYIARTLPRGTHEYLKFIRPSELARWGRTADLTLVDLTGITYNPLTRAFRLSPNTDVNYLAHFKRTA